MVVGFLGGTVGCLRLMDDRFTGGIPIRLLLDGGLGLGVSLINMLY